MTSGKCRSSRDLRRLISETDHAGVNLVETLDSGFGTAAALCRLKNGPFYGTKRARHITPTRDQGGGRAENPRRQLDAALMRLDVIWIINFKRDVFQVGITLMRMKWVLRSCTRCTNW
ncbi:hypothetical protein LSH36_673g00013 [Paralvinella palmiformis]|uniref:Uncharacterized protein n=1 Tax=Paralvinella palmiformis TaxID=53620 RepID=A0AAD9J3Y3_9ANNE|nr:hypothetical protein LSH36_673g00013 [Paralvinella palmiformis]